MTEKVLNYDRAVVPQETGWWCGPASTQVVLNGLGVRKAERDLMLEIEALEGNVRGGKPFDDQDGTDHIRQIAAVLNKHAPAGKWAVVEMPNDPPTAAQVEKLWSHIVASVDAGFGGVANIVAPVTNQPKAVAPSTISPNYGRSTIWHYFPWMGYGGVGKGRRVWIPDPGFPPHGYWLSLDQLATLIPPKGYAYSTAEAKAPAAGDALGPLTDAEQRELLDGVRYIRDQLGPKLAQWSASSSLGLTPKGAENTLRDGLAELRRLANAIGSKVGA
ncbi:lysin A [Gordonia phage BetterKatz]|uniref:Lysin A n=1 Tax=Gordonia phage BetterKatz TaxID=1821551 RepID=A0A142KC31_9CAUD|nr:endolysin [Gordonia phage BetterKatz]AMS03664.1 lysin A [Gordonia phage BetterKatz]